jgi:hypothetical protein
MKKPVVAPAVTPSKLGRPRVPYRSTAMTVWVPNSTYDQLLDLAKRRETSLSATVRQLLILRLR